MKTKKVERGPAVSAKRMRAIKLAAQARDRALVASGAIAPEVMLFLGADKLRGAKIEWPKGSLLEEEA